MGKPRAYDPWTDHGDEGPKPERQVLDPARVERILVQAASEGHSVTYRQMLDMFGHRLGSGTVGHLCRVLGVIDAARTARGEPHLACLVVKAADRQPGVGYFGANDPLDADSRIALVVERQRAVFAWAAGLKSSCAGRLRTDHPLDRSVPAHDR